MSFGGFGLKRRVHNLLRAVRGEYSELGDFDEDRDAYEVSSIESLGRRVREVLGTLTEREAQAIRLRFGLEDGRPLTLRAAGQIMGVTAERVRQIEAESLKKLREPARRNLLPRPLY